jgi:hypothetical protein
VTADPAADQAPVNAVPGTPRELLPLRTLANMLTVLLPGTLALTAARLAVPLFDRGDTAVQADVDARPLAILSQVAVLAAGIAVLVWFRRARINAELRGWDQRYGRAWTFWGWIIPVANLWIPLQIMEEIWQAGYPGARRGWVRWLPTLWWVSWVLVEFLIVPQPGSAALILWSTSPPGSAQPADYGPFLPGSWPRLAIFAVAGLALTAIVRTVSGGPLGTSGETGCPA